MPPSARVRYVDRLTAGELRNHYPELDGSALVPVDVVDDGETLSRFPDASLDFVIASHFLEHCEDPIGALGSFLRVVRPSGVVYLAVPDRRFSFDAKRKTTPLDHLIADHERGPAASRSRHYLDWARSVLGLSGEEAEREARRLEEVRYSIHFHVWTRRSFRDFLRAMRDRGAPFTIAHAAANRVEIIAVLRRTA